MARLAISKDVLRDLAIRSKNKCAFPGCDHPILNSEGEYIAELCALAEFGGGEFTPFEDCHLSGFFAPFLKITRAILLLCGRL